MIDVVKLLLQAGKGGNGRVSFRREKYVPKGGPDGGKGGSGGSIIIKVDPELNTLTHLAGIDEIVAKPGQPGNKRQKTGADAEDVVVRVPVGTRVWLLAENRIAKWRRRRQPLSKLFHPGDINFKSFELEHEGAGVPSSTGDSINIPEEVQVPLKQIPDVRDLQDDLLLDLNQPGEEIVVCQGGFGGRGNMSFKSSRQTTPLMAEYGTPGEARYVIFELRLLADIGLVGYPNAGKSTFISTVTKARPKVASYPFTTLEPNLGVWRMFEGREVVVADIPGIIGGASQGKGLGLTFLRHIENCQQLLLMLALEDELILSASSPEDTQEIAEQYWQQYQSIMAEMQAYSTDLLDKNMQIVCTKADLFSEELREAVERRFSSENLSVACISSATRAGIDSLEKTITHSL